MRHGTRYTYQRHKCRCDECRQANADYQREYLRGGRRTIPAADTRRAIRAAADQGITQQAIADTSGYSRYTIASIQSGRTMRTRPETAQDIRDAVRVLIHSPWAA